MASVRIPAQLRSLTGGDRVLNLQGSTVSELIEDLEVKYPGFKERLLDPSGEPSSFVGIYVGGEDIRFLSGLSTELAADTEVSIVPAASGGA
jgi:molybdopterin synthase sulfur carrier subunit